jgi:hypothetical protein
MISTAGVAVAAAASQQQQKRRQPVATAAAVMETADGESEENMLRVLGSIKVTASLRNFTTPNTPKYPSSAPGSRPSSAAAAPETPEVVGIGGGVGSAVRGKRLSLTDLNGTEHRIQFSPQEEVLYQPAFVASDAKFRSAAKAAKSSWCVMPLRSCPQSHLDTIMFVSLLQILHIPIHDWYFLHLKPPPLLPPPSRLLIYLHKALSSHVSICRSHLGLII